MTAMFFKTVVPDELIPQQSLSILPLRPEALSKWSDECDLFRFLFSVFDISTEFADEVGNQRKVNYSFYSKVVYEIGREKFQGIGLDFLKNAYLAKPQLDIDSALEIGLRSIGDLNREVIESADLFKKHGVQIISKGLQPQLNRIPDLWDDETFGLMAKYAIAWDGVLSSILQESGFFSIAHVLEASTELDCSILLASNFYYKQGFQVLRSFLEHMVVQLYFCENESAFSAWKANQYRIPSFRGHDGMLQHLVLRKVLSDELASVGAQLYGALNGAIHGKASQLIHRDVIHGRNSVLTFTYDRLAEWSKYFSECVDFAIRMLRTTAIQLAKLNVEQGPVCSVCREREKFDVEEKRVGEHNYTTLICQKCGNSMTFSSSQQIVVVADTHDS